MDKEFKPTWLYIKQHNITGLKYFGKTSQKNLHKYNGSGHYWRLHLNKHGCNISTIWSKLFTDRDEIIKFALNFSAENNIVKSGEWANLKEENGIDGGGCPGRCGNKKGFRHSQKTKNKISNTTTGKKCIPLSLIHKNKIKNTWKVNRQFGASATAEIEAERCRKIGIAAKDYNALEWHVSGPYNKEYIIKNLVDFCKENNLPYNTMKESSNRGNTITRGLAKGWSVKRINDASRTPQ